MSVKLPSCSPNSPIEFNCREISLSQRVSHFANMLISFWNSVSYLFHCVFCDASECLLSHADIYCRKYFQPFLISYYSLYIINIRSQYHLCETSDKSIVTYLKPFSETPAVILRHFSHIDL